MNISFKFNRCKFTKIENFRNQYLFTVLFKSSIKFKQITKSKINITCKKILPLKNTTFNKSSSRQIENEVFWELLELLSYCVNSDLSFCFAFYTIYFMNCGHRSLYHRHHVVSTLQPKTRCSRGW